MRNKISIADYLYFLSVKYEVEIESFFRSLVTARESQEVSCGKLIIQCRQKAKDHDVFLITNGYQVVAQFFIPRCFFDQPNQMRNLSTLHLFRKTSKQETSDNPKQIRDLKFGMKQINIQARVVDVPKATLVFTRFGEYAHVSNAVIADETGAIKICLWNERISEVAVDSVVQIENASVTRFRGENQLRLGKNGRLSVIENPDFPSMSEVDKGHVLKNAF